MVEEDVKTREDEENTIECAKPDGGYGWVVLFVGFSVSFILDGSMYSLGTKSFFLLGFV